MGYDETLGKGHRWGKPRSTEAMEREESGQISQDVKRRGKNPGPTGLCITLRNKTFRTLRKRQQSKKELLFWG